MKKIWPRYAVVVVLVVTTTWHFAVSPPLRRRLSAFLPFMSLAPSTRIGPMVRVKDTMEERRTRNAKDEVEGGEGKERREEEEEDEKGSFCATFFLMSTIM